MKILIASDHRGVELKNKIQNYLIKKVTIKNGTNITNNVIKTIFFIIHLLLVLTFINYILFILKFLSKKRTQVSSKKFLKIRKNHTKN